MATDDTQERAAREEDRADGALPPELERSELARRLWRSWRRRGLDRRSFVRLLTATGAGAALAACDAGGGTESGGDGPGAAEEEGRGVGPDASAGESGHFKDTSPFLLHGNRNLETRLENLGGFLTPNELFFVRNNSRSVAVDPERYRLQVGGDGVERELELTYDDLLEMPSRTVFCYIECGGNQRRFFDVVLDRTASGTQWGRGGVSMAVWTGVPLAEVLDRAGVREEAVDVQLIGLDTESPEQGFRRPIPVAKAVDPDTLLAYRMNGAVLPRDHGFPLRAVVPGWVGSTSIKWLGRIDVTTERVWTRNVTTSYVLIGDDYPPEGEALGRVATTQSIKSALGLSWPARLAAGTHTLRGYAHSPHAPIARVEWSDDDGDTWHEARVLDPRIRYAWNRFEFEWEASSGAHALLTRATDEAGNAQPEELPFNEKGYLFNLPLPHPIRVS